MLPAFRGDNTSGRGPTDLDNLIHISGITVFHCGEERIYSGKASGNSQ
jgi:hypothetical protein